MPRPDAAGFPVVDGVGTVLPAGPGIGVLLGLLDVAAGALLPLLLILVVGELHQDCSARYLDTSEQVERTVQW